MKLITEIYLDVLPRLEVIPDFNDEIKELESIMYTVLVSNIGIYGGNNFTK